MYKLIIIATFLSACVTDEGVDAQPLDATIYSKCGKRPGPEPGWAVVPGTYPGQSTMVCLPTQQYIDRDAHLQKDRDWTTCVQIATCQLYGDC